MLGDDEVKEAKGEDAHPVLSIQLFVDANGSLRPTANCPFPRINWKGTRVYKRWLKGHMPTLNKVRACRCLGPCVWPEGHTSKNPHTNLRSMTPPNTHLTPKHELNRC